MLYRYDLTKNYPNGDRYVGEAIEAGMKDGKGKYTWAATGASYAGEWKKDVMHGWGTYTLPDVSGATSSDAAQDGYTYEGYFANGKRHTTAATDPSAQNKGNQPAAHGRLGAVNRYYQQQQMQRLTASSKQQQQKMPKCQFASGRVYVGEWTEDRMHGHGKLQGSPRFDNFTEYEGPFVENRRHGKDGKCTYRDGRMYFGEWDSDQMNGKGKMWLPVAGISPSTNTKGDQQPLYDVYEGSFKHNSITGHGKIQFVLNEEEYEGEFLDGAKHGSGFQQLRFSPSSRNLVNGFKVTKISYQGTFQSGLRHGRGDIETEAFAYSGGLVFDQLEGQGILNINSEFVSSSPFGPVLQYEGNFHSDTLSGIGKAKLADGSVYKGDWESSLQHGNGERVGFYNNSEIVRLVPADAVGKYSGMWAFGKKHGFGRAKYEHLRDSYSYDGQWEHDAPCGDGKWEIVQLRAGTTMYAGTVAQGLPHGPGQMKYPDGNVYKGEWARGMRSGKGRLTFANEDHYNGEWLHNQYHGHGTFNEHHTSNSYTGTWAEGKKHGQGIYIEYGKSHYSGEFRNGTKHGRGVLKFNNGDRYEGEFRHDLYEPRGTLTFFDGLSHEGEFKEGKLHGVATTKFVNGNAYSGQYVKGEIEGKGEMTLTNKDRYAGEFARGGVKSGRGTFYFAEGMQLECGWKDNALHGEGTFIGRDGSKALRQYNDGSLVKETKLESHNPLIPKPESSSASASPDKEENMGEKEDRSQKAQQQQKQRKQQQQQPQQQPRPQQQQHLQQQQQQQQPQQQQQQQQPQQQPPHLIYDGAVPTQDDDEEQPLLASTSMITVSEDGSTYASPFFTDAAPPRAAHQPAQQQQQPQRQQRQQQPTDEDEVGKISEPRKKPPLPIATTQKTSPSIATASAGTLPSPPKVMALSLMPLQEQRAARAAANVATALDKPHIGNTTSKFRNPTATVSTSGTNSGSASVVPSEDASSPQLTNEELAERAAQAVEQLSCQISELEVQMVEAPSTALLGMKRKMALLRASRLREEQRYSKFSGNK